MHRFPWAGIIIVAVTLVATSHPHAAATARLRAADLDETSGPGTRSTGRGPEPGEVVWPLDPPPAVLRDFDPPEQPWLAGHRGVDLAARAGQDVRAAAAGVVTFAGEVAGRPVMTVTHGALRTTYEPVDALLTAGARVNAGTAIGVVSAAGSHCGACIHWGLREGTRYLDPLAFVDGGPVRLLPVWDAHAPRAGPESSANRQWGAALSVAATASMIAAGASAAAALLDLGKH